MRNLRSLCPLAIVAAFLVAAGPLRAQSANDSLAVSRALGASLQDDARAVLRPGVCRALGDACRLPQADSVPDPILTQIAQASGARIVPREDSIPACPWGHDPPHPRAGYVVALANIRWSQPADTAVVWVTSHCDNPPGYTHDIFMRMDEYTFLRSERGEWRLLSKRLRLIT